MAKRVVLAYSGGLDTSVAVRWMIEELGVEVITVACDVGQGGDWEALQARALGAGAIDAIVVDCREEFARRLRRPRPQGQRPLREPLPAGLGAVAAGDRQAPGRGRPQPRRRRRRPRLHRQGQRPGALRGRHPGPGPRPRGRRPGARTGA